MSSVAQRLPSLMVLNLPHFFAMYRKDAPATSTQVSMGTSQLAEILYLISTRWLVLYIISGSFLWFWYWLGSNHAENFGMIWRYHANKHIDRTCKGKLQYQAQIISWMLKTPYYWLNNHNNEHQAWWGVRMQHRSLLFRPSPRPPLQTLNNIWSDAKIYWPNGAVKHCHTHSAGQTLSTLS